jgi:hypothetical protein
MATRKCQLIDAIFFSHDSARAWLRLHFLIRRYFLSGEAIDTLRRFSQYPNTLSIMVIGEKEREGGHMNMVVAILDIDCKRLNALFISEDHNN